MSTQQSTMHGNPHKSVILLLLQFPKVMYFQKQLMKHLLYMYNTYIRHFSTCMHTGQIVYIHTKKQQKKTLTGLCDCM